MVIHTGVTQSEPNRHMKKWLKRFGILTVLWLLCVGVIFAGSWFYLNSGHAAGFLQRQINSRIPGSLLWEHHTLSLFEGTLEIQNLRIRGVDQKEIAGFDRLVVNLDWLPLMRGEIKVKGLHLEAPRADLAQSKSGPLNITTAFIDANRKPEQPKTGSDVLRRQPFNLIIEQFTIRNGRLSYEHATHAFKTVVDQFDLEGSGNLSDQTAQIRLDTDKISIDGVNGISRINTLGIQAGLKGGLLSPFRIEAVAPLGQVTLSGDVKNIFDPSRIDSALKLHVLLSRLPPLFGPNVVIDGPLKADLTIDKRLDNPDVTLKLQVNHGQLLGIPVNQVALALNMQNRFLQLHTLAVDSAGGRIAGTGQIDLRNAFKSGFFSPERNLDAISYTFKLSSNEIQLHQLPPLAPHLAGSIETEVIISGTGITPETMSAEASVAVSGHLSSPKISKPLPVTLATSGSYSEGIANIKNLALAIEELKVNGRGRLNIASQEIQSRFTVNAPALDAVCSRLGLPPAKGAVNLTAAASGFLKHPVLELDLQGSGLKYQQISIGDLTLAANLDTSGMLTVSKLVLKNQGSTLTVKGGVPVYRDTLLKSADMPLDFSAALKNIELTDFIHQKSFFGSLNGQLKLTGTAAAPQATLTLTGHQLRLPDVRLGTFEAELGFKGGLLTIEKTGLQNGRSRIEIKGHVRLFDAGDWHLLEDPPFELDIQTMPVHLEDFIDAVKGEIRLEAHLNGKPRAPKGEVAFKGRKLDFGVQKIHSVDLTSHLNGSQLNIENLLISIAPDETITLNGWVDQNKTYDLTLSSTPITLDRIDALDLKDLSGGKFVVNLFGRGSLEKPEFKGHLVLSGLSLKGEKLTDLRLDLALVHQQITVQGRSDFDLKGSYHLDTKDLDVSGQFYNTDLSPYFRILQHPGFGGHLSGLVTARGSLDKIADLIVNVDLSELTVVSGSTELVSTHRAKLIYENKNLAISPMELTLLKEGRLKIDGRGRFEGPVDFQIAGRIPVAVAKPWARDVSQLTGSIDLDARVTGDLSRPALNASVKLDQVGLTLNTLSQKIHKINGRIDITPQSVSVKHLDGYLDKGKITLKGRMGLDRFKPTTLNFELKAQALPINIPETLDLTLNVKLGLTGSIDKAALSGEIVLLEGLYYKDVNLSLLLNTDRPRLPPPPKVKKEPHPVMNNLSLNAAVKHREPFRVGNNIAELEISPDLHITGTAAEPKIEGRAQVDSGTVSYGQRTFEVTRGIVDFVNPYQIEPNIDIKSEISIRKWRVYLGISGTPQNLKFELNSKPSESDGDILSLLLFGRTSTELSQGEGAGSASAGEMLGLLISSAIEKDLKKATGLDILKAETVTDTEGDDQDRVRVTLGKNLTKRLQVKYSTESKEGEQINKAVAEYTFLQNVLVSGYSDSEGKFGGALRYRLEFR